METNIFYNFCTKLATTKIIKSDQIKFRNKIKQRVIKKVGTNITRDNFQDVLTPQVLLYMLRGYDKLFFRGELLNVMKQNKCNLTICFENICIDSKVAGVCYSNHISKCYTINLSSSLFKNAIKHDGIYKNNGGIKCKGVFECIMLTFEHEMIHAMVGCLCKNFGGPPGDPSWWGKTNHTYRVAPGEWKGAIDNKSHHSKTFMSILNNVFGQTQYQHNLFSTGNALDDTELKILKKQIKVGDLIIFSTPDYGGGGVNQITGILQKKKRDTITVFKRGQQTSTTYTIPYNDIISVNNILVELVILLKIKKNSSKKTCPPGKELNPKTGRCINIKIKKKVSKKTCPPGKELNPKTGRCINIKIKKKVSKKTCPSGKELNPKTGRCINIKTKKKVSKKICPPGKEINPKTGRCINIKTKKKICPPTHTFNPETRRCIKIK